MSTLLSALLAVHAAAHLLGPVRAFAPARLPRMHTDIRPATGLAWLACALALAAAAALHALGAPCWALVAAPALALSQALIVTAWADARFGTVANVVLLVPVLLGVLDLRADSFRSRQAAAVDAALAAPRAAADAPPTPDAPLTEADLTALPPLVRKYLHRVGAVGRPRVRNFAVRFTGEIRGAPDAPWMPFRAEQVSVIDPPARYFHLTATRAGVPFDVLHHFAGGAATMRVRVLGLFGVVDASGPRLDQSETVTWLNDVCLLAPAALVDVPARWEPLGARSVRVSLTAAAHRVSAILTFDDAGDLVNFVSGDRFKTADGVTYESFPWETPLSDYRDLGAARVASRGDALWRERYGAFVYGRFVMQALAYNVAPAAR